MKLVKCNANTPRCTGGFGDDVCNSTAGYTGPACSACDHNNNFWRDLLGFCRSCPSKELSLSIAITFNAIVMFYQFWLCDVTV